MLDTPQTPPSVRWTVMVSPETDRDLRAFLGSRGMRKGDLSKFIERAVRWQMFERNMAEARAGFSDMSDDEIESLVDEAVEAVRTKKPGSRSKKNR